MNESLSINEQKAELRRRLLQRRRELTTGEWRAASRNIQERLKDLPAVAGAEVIHSYLPITEKKEIDTFPFLRWLLARGKKIVVPITHFDDVVLRHVRLPGLDGLRPNKWGVPEPVEQIEADIEEIDLIIVPMVGGDRRHNRLGYGKGYYDRFLKQVQCPKWGLLYHRCLVDRIPVDQYDVPLDGIVTDLDLI